MLNVHTDLLLRLKANDSSAWFELWEVFGHAIERLIGSIAARYFTQETVRDISQETLSRVFKEIDRFDQSRGVKFSTWLYAIARNVVYAELTTRGALKRGGGTKPISFAELEGFDPADEDATDGDFEHVVFRAKVLRALKDVQSQVEILEYEAYRMRVIDDLPGKDIASQLGVSEASISRYLKRVRDALRQQIAFAIAAYSWTDEERGEITTSGLDKADDSSFDQALGTIYQLAEEDRRRAGEVTRTATGMRLG